MQPLYVTIFVSAALSGAVSYLTSRLSQRNQRLIDRRRYRAAILAEIRGLHGRLLEYEAAMEQRVLTGQISSAQVAKILLQPGDTVVFNNNASSLGLFDRRTALRVMRFYAAIRGLEGRALVLSEISGGAATGPDIAALKAHLEFVRQLRRRAHVLMRRLRRRKDPRLAACLKRISPQEPLNRRTKAVNTEPLTHPGV